MGENKPHWTERLKTNMERVTAHAQQYASKTAPIIGALYTLSRTIHAGAVAVTAATTESMPHVSFVAAGVAATTLGTNKLFKVAWEHVKEIKDTTDGYQIDPEGTEQRTIASIDQAVTRLQQLEAENQELRDTLAQQISVTEEQLVTVNTLTNVLEQNSEIMKRLLKENRNATQALEKLLKHRSVSEEDKETVRAALATKYRDELEDATNSGLIDPVEFDAKADDLIKIEGGKVIIDNDKVEALSLNEFLRRDDENEDPEDGEDAPGLR